jgi:alpha-ketoglutarate-dependent taurine dioxygenase
LTQTFGFVDFVLVHGWSTGDVVVWNNIALQHGRPEKVGSGARDLWRLKAGVGLAGASE